VALIISGGVCIAAAGGAAVLAARSAGISIHVNLHDGVRHLASVERPS
jgi:hypothetical protein